MFERFSKIIILNNSLLSYGVSLLIFLAIVVVVVLFKKIILKKLKRWSEKTTTTLDDFLISLMQRYLHPVSYLAAFYVSAHYLVLPVSVDKAIGIIVTIVLSFSIIRIVIVTVDYIFQSYVSAKESFGAAARSYKGMLSAIQVIVWGIGIIFLLDNLGFKISTIIAGLGIGGVAVALAAQAILGDLFSYVAILMDRPFEIGDFIVVGDFMGTIENIGIKTTRIRSLGGEQIVFSNSDLTGSRMRNYKRMDKRRIVFRLGVTYQTTSAQVKEIPLVIRTIIANVKNALVDRVHFFSFGDSSLVFEVVYYVLSQDYNIYMDVQQEINFAIKEALEQRNIEFAYPTQTIHVSK
ncbi:MAG: mechanosensitive ion channel family protein [Candidatus Omnitrophota bacterium]|nr:mechanosensitive ion channel family protein [Candidatus Omnitrophota bacterium]